MLGDVCWVCTTDHIKVPKHLLVCAAVSPGVDRGALCRPALPSGAELETLQCVSSIPLVFFVKAKLEHSKM